MKSIDVVRSLTRDGTPAMQFLHNHSSHIRMLIALSARSLLLAPLLCFLVIQTQCDVKDPSNHVNKNKHEGERTTYPCSADCTATGPFLDMNTDGASGSGSASGHIKGEPGTLAMAVNALSNGAPNGMADDQWMQYLHTSPNVADRDLRRYEAMAASVGFPFRAPPQSGYVLYDGLLLPEAFAATECRFVPNLRDTSSRFKFTRCGMCHVMCYV